MVGQKDNLVGHLILPRIFPIRQNVRCVFCLVGQLLILVGHFLMSDHYFKTCFMTIFIRLFKDSTIYFNFLSTDLSECFQVVLNELLENIICQHCGPSQNHIPTSKKHLKILFPFYKKKIFHDTQ